MLSTKFLSGKQAAEGPSHYMTMLKRNMEHLWTIQEVADYLRVSTATVRRWVRTGVLVSYRPGGRFGRRLFKGAEVREFLTRGQGSTSAGA